MSLAVLLEVCQVDEEQMRQVLLAVQRVQEETGFGEVRITIERGHLRFVEETVRSELPRRVACSVLRER